MAERFQGRRISLREDTTAGGFHSVAYLGFQNGGAKFSLATSAHTKRGQTKFSNFFPMSKKICQRRMAQCPPPKYATDFTAGRYHGGRIPLREDTTAGGFHCEKMLRREDSTAGRYHGGRIPLREDTTAGGFHCGKIPRWEDSTAGRYHGGRIPLREDTTAGGFHCGKIPQREDSTAGRYHGGRIPLREDTTAGGFHCGEIPRREDSTAGRYHGGRIPLRGDTTAGGFHCLFVVVFYEIIEELYTNHAVSVMR